jgi:hypothetical protein
MPATTTGNRDSEEIAVIRSYQPIRIERELLAQVFFLAEHGRSDGGHSAAGPRGIADQAADQRAAGPTQTGLLGQRTSELVNELEAVA